MAEIGLVTVLYNSNNVLDGFFKSLTNQTYKSYHVFFIDNQNSAITEQVVADLSIKYPIGKYTYLKNATNVGVAKANNQGINMSVSEGTTYTILLNNDIEFDDEDFLKKMYSTAVRQQEHMIIPKILYFDTRKIWMAGGDFLEYKGIVMHVGQDKDDGPEFNNTTYFNYAPTCFMLIDNKLFSKIGIMNEDYFVYYDDVDFLYRANKKGYKILYMHDLTVLHKVSSSTGGMDSLFTIYYTHRNRIYFILTYSNYLKRSIALLYTFLSRIIRYTKYDAEQRKVLVKGLVDGFKLSYKKAK